MTRRIQRTCVKRLDAGYEIQVRRFRQLDEATPLYAKLTGGRALDEIDNLESALTQLPVRRETALIDVRSRQVLHPHDVGEGIWTSRDCWRQLNSEVYTSLEGVAQAACWNDVQPSRRVGMTIQEQVEVLRYVAFHATWIGYVNPYIRGSSSGDEMSLAMALLEAARKRKRARVGPILMDLHTVLPENPGNVIANLQPRLPVASPDFQLRIIFWDFDMKDRYIMAGDAEGSAGNLRPQRIRWVVAPGHVARNNYSDKQLRATPWQLLPRNEIGSVKKEYLDSTPAHVERLR